MKKSLSVFTRNRSLLLLALPIFFELLLQILIGFVDQIQLSHDQIAVAAINQTNQVVNLIFLAFSVLSTASIIMITQLKGLSDERRVKSIYNLSFYFNLVMGLAISALLFFGAEGIFRLMHVDANTQPDAVIYMRLTGGFAILQALSTTFAAFLRSNKLMIQSTIVTAAVNIVNIAGNALALFVFKAGITGVAISSTVARAVGFLIILGMYIHYVHVSLSPRNLWPFPGRLFRKLLSIGIPSAGESLSYSLSQLVVLIVINNFFLLTQNIDVNIRGYVLNFTTIVYMFANGISQAMQVTLGPLIATKKFEQADRLVRDTHLMSALITLVCSLLFLAIGYPLFSALLKIPDPVLKAQALKVVMIILGIDVLLEFGRAGNIPFVRALQTAGDIYYPVGLAIVCCWSLAVGGSFIAARFLGLGVIGCWIASGLDENIRCLVFTFRWRSKKWQKKELLLPSAEKQPARESEPLNEPDDSESSAAEPSDQ